MALCIVTAISFPKRADRDHILKAKGSGTSVDSVVGHFPLPFASFRLVGQPQPAEKEGKMKGTTN